MQTNSGFKCSTSFNGQKQQRIDKTAYALSNEKQENHRSCIQASVINDKWRLLKITLQAPFLNVQMMSDHIQFQGLVLHQMTSDHNRSELGIQDHSNEPSSSKLVPKVVPLAVKTATSRQELELLFHHHIAKCVMEQQGRMPTKIELTLEQSQQGVSNDVLSPTHYPCDSARTFRVILFSIHNDEWKSFQCHHQTALRSYALSWKPCQGDSLNLPDHRIHKDGDGDASFQLKSDSLPHAHAQTTKTFYKHQDSRIMKAQELKTKTSAQTLIYKIFLQRYQVYQGRLLASFQDDAKYEHVGQDTRSQGGKDDQDGRIKI
ncbi:hypothetical protein Tco_0140442 [Tanacetum coccineum]